MGVAGDIGFVIAGKALREGGTETEISIANCRMQEPSNIKYKYVCMLCVCIVSREVSG